LLFVKVVLEEKQHFRADPISIRKVPENPRKRKTCRVLNNDTERNFVPLLTGTPQIEGLYLQKKQTVDQYCQSKHQDQCNLKHQKGKALPLMHSLELNKSENYNNSGANDVN